MLRWVTGRNLALLLLLGAAVSIAGIFKKDATDRYMAWRYPPAPVAGPMGREILDSAERLEKQHVEAMHARILELLAKSREEGFDTSALEPRAARALQLNVKGLRPEAIGLLNRLEMDIPRKKVQYIPMAPEEEKLDIAPDVQGADVRADVKKARAPKRRKKAKRSEDVE